MDVSHIKKTYKSSVSTSSWDVGIYGMCETTVGSCPTFFLIFDDFLYKIQAMIQFKCTETLKIVTDRLKIVVLFEGGPEESGDVCVGVLIPIKACASQLCGVQNTWHL